MTDNLRLRIAREMTSIVTLYADLHTEALHRPANSAGLYIPGGDALNMLGPAANLEAWQHRYETLEEAGFEAGQDYVFDQVDSDEHPLLVLAGWEDVIRDARNQPTDLRATVQRAADYIRSSMDWMLDTDQYGNIMFLGTDALLHDLHRVRSRMENLLHDGIRYDRGVPCMECGTLLVKIWGNNPDGTDDKWHCSTCSEWSNEEQYRLAVKYAARAHAKGLTASDMEDEYRVKPGTLRAWVSLGKVKRRGRDNSGRWMFDVSYTLAMRDSDNVDKVS